MTAPNRSDPDTPGADLRVTVAMLTFRREHLLPASIAELNRACIDYPHSELLIVDNDPEGGAEPIVSDLASRSVTPAIQYVHEPRPGISAARNRALDEADGDVLVFIDDDEVPSEGWLSRLMTIYCDLRPTAVVGPVRHEFESTPDPWIVSGEFFIRRRNKSGTHMGEAPSNNLLLDLAVVRTMGLRFDGRLGLTGGEDSLFTKQLVKSGGTIVWCDEAEVVDQVPQSRANRRWVILRAFRLGNTKPRVDLMLADSTRSKAATRARYALHGMVRIAAGGLRSLWGVAIRSRRHSARGVRTAARGAGMLAGAFGYVYAEYARKAAQPVSATSVHAAGGSSNSKAESG